MNSITGLRPPDLGLSGTTSGAWGAAAASAQAGAGVGGGAQRWLDGLASADGAVLNADVPAGASGLSAAEHAQRVLGALLGD